MPALVSAANEAKARLLIDVSVVYKADFKTGVQRVVRSVLGCLFNEPPQGYEIVPVFLDAESGPWCYKVAAVYFDGKNITFDSEAAHSAPALIPQHGDILLGLDLAGGHVVNADREGLFKRLRQAGVHVYFVVHDLLPVTMPQFFSPADSAGHEDWLKAIARVDGVICNSEATADDFRHWAANQRKANQPDPSFQIKSFHLGADIGNSSPSTGLPEGAEEVLSDLAARPTFLMVGTIEPRKGHPQVLRAFELLWAANLDVNLAIVGKQGWMTEDFCDRLRKHPEAGRRLFWLNGVSDEYLEKVYASSACLIAASEGEGFGLPLIEAAQKHWPILARDVPVFREVAGDYAFYFTGKDESLLAASIKEWLALYESNQHPKSDHMPWLTWKQSTDQLVECALSMSSKQCG